MKTLKSFFTFLLLVIFIGVSSQAQNTNPNHVPDLNLTDIQKEKLKEIKKDFNQKRRDAMEAIKTSDDKDMSTYYDTHKALEDEENKAQKLILTAEQLSHYEGYELEKKMERRGNMLVSQAKRMDNDYPGIELTPEQNVALLDKKEEYKNWGWKIKDGKMSYQEKQMSIHREVLDDRQFALYEKIEEGKRELKEAKILKEYKKGIKIAEELLPVVQDFTLPKFKVLRQKLEAKISSEDKLILEQLRAERLQSFDKILNEVLNEDFSISQFKNPELIRNIELTKEMLEENADLVSNVWLYEFEHFLSDKDTKVKDLAKKYAKEIDALEKELLWTTKETVKKGAVIVSEEYPIPPVAIILSSVTEFPNDAKLLFLLLDPEVEFSMELPEFGKGEGDHFASAFPNPAVRNQTLDFFLQQDTHVSIDILDESGRVVKTLASEFMNKGNQKLNVNINDLNSQLYFYRISTGEEVTMLKFTVVK